MAVEDPRPGVLDGIRVLDLSWGIAGPMATMLLADNGAEVVKIEPPGGDPFAAQAGYVVWQRGKRRTILDLRAPSGAETFAALAADADVLIESFSPGVTRRLGIDYERLASVNHRLVYCSITGYGRDNAHRDRPGYDGLVAARTGLVFDHRGRPGTPMEYLCGRPGPHPEFGAPEGLVRGAGRPGPLFPRSTWSSLGASLLATLGIAAALRAREVTGQGQWVETSLLQGALAAVSLNWQRVENPDAPSYWMWPCDARSIEGLFECSDGRWVHHWTVRPQWVRAAADGDKLGAPDADHLYRDDPDRLGMEASDLLAGYFLYPDLAAAFRRFPSDEWVRVAEDSGMGVAPVRSPAEALNDPSFLEDGCVVELDHPEHGRIRHVGNVLEFSATRGEPVSPVRDLEPAPLPRCGAGGDSAGASTTRASGPGTAEPGAAAAADALPGGPLSGIRVLDLGLGVAGPFGPRLLADLGAEVIKVHALHDTFWAGTHMGLGTNRGKRSISLNLKDPRGRPILHALIERSDVVTTNWRPGAADRLGIGYDDLRGRHPRLVFCNTRGYEKGPRSALPGTDQTANALCGTEWEDGAVDAGNPPVWSRSGMGDTGNALLAAIAITLALYHRERTGDGQAVATSIVNACLLNTSYAWVHAGGRPGEWEHVDGSQYGLAPTYRLYETADGWVFVAAVNEAAQAALRSTLAIDAATDGEPLAAHIAKSLAGRTSAEAFALLDAAGVPVEVADETFCRKLFDDEAMRSRGWVSVTDAGGVGRFEDPGLLIDFSATPGAIPRGPCLCGEHTREILLELGHSSDDVDRLAGNGVVLEQPR